MLKTLVLAVVCVVAAQVTAQSVDETIDKALGIFTLVEPSYMAALRKDSVCKVLGLAVFYRDAAAWTNEDKIHLTTQIPHGNPFKHLAHDGVAYTQAECNQIKDALSEQIFLKTAAWGIVLQDAEDMVAAQDEAAAILANFPA